ncbi:hypothetical protein A3D80_02920 [Candidatus Roizmanbacteria bacterium RIFCSPHIGHO2_02_FULL_40_13b]|nr:MAG: hypothetical protein A3D80_02920 [Candidatus Roizmanbacteria bacterium RIFCSPHIGHO2_02_FULL_40_13b]OGK49432.1 MAG: hypothetical protein A3A56_00055 [Candidatus Roizmanbacteria bacterium RIFCSPLOWO2_01_FULL_40_32]
MSMRIKVLSKNCFRVISISTLIVAALIGPTSVRAAANSQSCPVSSSCIVGEFLYDDAYVPITNATCSITSHYPDGSMYFNAQALTGTSDGWYGHNFTTSSTEGMYRSQICCTAGTEYLCIDKSFTVVAQSTQSSAPSTNDIASAVWGYSGRTLTGFNSLISDIWSSAARTLTGAGLTSGSIATIEKTTNETRLLLEKQVNKPTVKSFIEEEPKLQAKLDATKENAKNIYFTTAQIQKNVKKLQSKWANISTTSRLEQINTLAGLIGNTTDNSAKKTLFGMNKWFISRWNFSSGKLSTTYITDLYTQIKNTQQSLISGNKNTTVFPVQAMISANLLRDSIGDVADDEMDATLFGEISEINQYHADLETYSQKLVTIQKDWKKLDTTKKQKLVVEYNRDILALNRIPQIGAIQGITTSVTTDKQLRNSFLSLLGLVKANKRHLAQNPETSFASTWLELGSIVFKTLVTNPSTLITQTTEVKYYLPKEVKKQSIISMDKELTLKFDEQKGQYYVIGEFELEPGESKTVSVSTSDIWSIVDDELKSLKAQASALLKPLEKTPYFAQGVTLQSDIEVALDKIKLNQERAETPEEKLFTYSESEIELKSVKTKIDTLKDLASQVSSSSTLLGFVGATQSLAVWGLIIIMSAGFVFLTLYMRKLSNVPGETQKIPKSKKKKAVIAEVKVPLSNKLRVNLHVVVFVLLYGASVSLFSVYATSKLVSNQNNGLNAQVLGTQTQSSPLCPSSK